jgi:hypothetical protein
VRRAGSARSIGPTRSVAAGFVLCNPGSGGRESNPLRSYAKGADRVPHHAASAAPRRLLGRPPDAEGRGANPGLEFWAQPGPHG